MKRRCLVCADDDADDANQKGRRKTIWGVSVCGDVGDGDTSHNAMVPLTAGSVASSNLISMV